MDTHRILGNISNMETEAITTHSNSAGINLFEVTAQDDKFEEEYGLFLERQQMGSVVSDLDLLRRRLTRRNALISEVIKVM